MENMMNIINQIQEQTRVNRIKAAHETYKKIKHEIISQSLSRLEREIVCAMIEGYAHVDVKISKLEYSHKEELQRYFEDKGFKVYCDRMFEECGGVEFYIFIEWASKELNLQ